ncbi:MAG: hypothetical protein HY833_03925 [Candidatus Aenigmarchaeota archaeon]|nr:hypothetical protein [Candidatus Aenigmarchaeota archaeon]
MKDALRRLYHSRKFNVPVGIYGVGELTAGTVLLTDHLTTGLYQSLMAPGYEYLGNGEPASGVLGLVVGSVGTAKYVSYKLRNRRLARESRQRE